VYGKDATNNVREEKLINWGENISKYIVNKEYLKYVHNSFR
jgi:hypothetical protein